MTGLRAIVMVVVLAMLAAVGCGGDGGPTAPSANLNGMYRGSTAQGRPIAVGVEGNAVTTLSYDYLIQGAGCRSEGSASVSFSPPQPLEGNSFSYTVTSGSPRASITGTFSGSTATGSITVTAVSQTFAPGCSGSVTTTWTATK